MPPILADPKMIGVLASGLAGAILAIGGVYFLSARWRKRMPLPYCLSAFVFYSLVFIAAFERGILNSDFGSGPAADWVLMTLILTQAAVTAIGVALFTAVLFGGYLFLIGELDYTVSKVKSYIGCTFFCILFSIFLNPVDAVRVSDGLPARSLYQAALDNGSPEVVEAARRKAERTLTALREIGVLAGIEDTAIAVVHHVKGQFIDLPNAVVEEYMQAALVHHVLVEGGSAKPVILREIGSNRQIAQRAPNGALRRPTVAVPGVEPPPIR